MKVRRIAIAAMGLAAVLARGPALSAQSALPYVTVASSGAAERVGYDGVVEAVRQTVVAAQVAGIVLDVAVKSGDVVKAGQVLARIDARAAEQTTAAGTAQVQAARASLEVAGKELERQRLLYQQRFISLAALDRSEAQFKVAQAQVQAELAQTGVARTQTGYFLVRAPYAGVVADVPVTVGDMAMPGRALVTLYDPTALRVAAAVPQTAIPDGLSAQSTRVELSSGPAHQTWLEPTRATVLPTVDPGSHTVIVRLDLAANVNLRPGMFARAWLHTPVARGTDRIFIPTKALVRRVEMIGVYVMDAADRALLRQVRIGRASNDQIEILAGLSAGERVVTDPQAAARVAPDRQ